MYKINMKGFINKCLLFWTRFLLSQELTQVKPRIDSKDSNKKAGMNPFRLLLHK